MSQVTCYNHPERSAVEHCEVCHVPLCAYCLYYTSDGQRLCKTHADQAKAAGAFIRSPSTYAEGLVPAQVDASRVRTNGSPAPYEGSSTDVIGLIALIIGLISVGMCIPGAICLLAPLGMILSLVALLNAKDARSPRRTRTMAWIGMGLSGIWVVVACMCIGVYLLPGLKLSTITNVGLGQLPVTINARVTIAIATARITPTFRPFIIRTGTSPFIIRTRTPTRSTEVITSRTPTTTGTATPTSTVLTGR